MDDKLVGKQEDTFLLDILIEVWLQGMPRQMRSRLGLQAMYDLIPLCVAPPGFYIVSQVLGNQSIITGNLTLACTASLAPSLLVEDSLRRCRLVGQGESR